MKRALFIALATVAVLGLSTLAQADTIYISQDFEDEAFSVGYQFVSMPMGVGDAWTTEGLWQKGYGNSGVPEVSDDFAHSGSKSVKITRPASGQGYRLWGCTEIPEGGITSGQYVASMYLNLGDTGGGMTFGPQATSNVNAQAMTASGGAYFYITGGELKYRDWFGAETWSQSIATLPATGWFGVAAEVDLDAGTYDIWCDSGSGFEEIVTGIAIYEEPLPVDGLLFVPQNPASSNVWIDDCVLRTGVMIPEPSTLALLACGLVGLLAYAWRRRK